MRTLCFPARTNNLGSTLAACIGSLTPSFGSQSGITDAVGLAIAQMAVKQAESDLLPQYLKEAERVSGAAGKELFTLFLGAEAAPNYILEEIPELLRPSALGLQRNLERKDWVKDDCTRQEGKPTKRHYAIMHQVREDTSDILRMAGDVLWEWKTNEHEEIEKWARELLQTVPGGNQLEALLHLYHYDRWRYDRMESRLKQAVQERQPNQSDRLLLETFDIPSKIQ